MLTIAIALVVVATACGKKSGSGGTTATAPQESYYLSNGSCYQKSDNAKVDSSKCDGVVYFLSNGRCYESESKNSVDMSHCTEQVGQYYYLSGRCCNKDNNNQYVSDNYCQGSNTNSSRYEQRGAYCFDKQINDYVNPSLCSGSTGGQCVGIYYFIQSGFIYWVDCRGQNCSGYTLTNNNTHQMEQCR